MSFEESRDGSHLEYLNGILKFSTDKKKNNNFIEFKFHLIHRKHVPFLHNTAIKEMGLWA